MKLNHSHIHTRS